ncbi:EAL domain-containing protein [Novosphingobium flavum]|uniref:EAL domain-containing protein n=1 Tax=Novosphingobium flavum TaxID=1778672 RepID=A0A7X1FU59_9SPHN|nr:EAL domain-containing protein [Novosphingobium flavum]MBC2667023.1 EAL domain-containing protein [Novosphingobium flavum]
MSASASESQVQPGACAAESAAAAVRKAEERLHEAIEAMPHGVVLLDPEGRYILWNSKYAEIYRKSSDLFAPGVKLVDTLRSGVERGDYPEAVGREEEWLAERAAKLQGADSRHEQWLSDGRCIMIEERRTGDGGTIGLRVDITEMKRREDSFRLLFEDNPVPLLVYDPVGGLVVGANAAAAEHFDYPVAELTGMPAIRLFAAEEWKAVRRLLATSSSEKDRFWKQYTRSGDELEAVLFTRQSVVDGRLATIVSIFDVTERRKTEARIAHMARHDELTGLANRAHCRERLREMLAEPGEDKVCLALIDLDNFKPINDSYGHHIGDLVLAEAARRMRALVPRKNSLLCRLGGDEFAVLVRAPTTEKIHNIARSLVQVIAEPFLVSDYTLHIGATIGVAVAPDDCTDGPTLLRYADLALYAAKAERKGTIQRFRPDLDEAAREKAKLENDLREGLRRGELAVHYQPLIDLGTGEITAYEALLRWHHPERGLMYPDSFIPLAEEVGLIDVLGQFVLQQACREAAHWPDPVRVAINVSPLQFRNANLINIVVQALAAAGLPPDRLELEITEAVLMEKNAEVATQIRRIRALGVGISMDDFGTGYSSLSYLLSYPFTKIKIDRSFVMGLKDAPNSRVVVGAIVNLGRSLGLTVTAEGIEEAEDLDFLRQLGCEQGQGYLIGRAVPGETLFSQDRAWLPRLGYG